MKQTYLFRVDFWLNNFATKQKMVIAVLNKDKEPIPSNCAAIVGAEDRLQAIDKALGLCGMPVNDKTKREILAVDTNIIGVLHDGKDAS